MRISLFIANRIWYGDSLLRAILLPCSWLFQCLVRLRLFLYQKGFFSSHHCPHPMVVVGNLTVGGTGKTPLVKALAVYFKSKGYQPGIVLRGYKGYRGWLPKWVDPDHDDASTVGDEACLLALARLCPVYVSPDRVKGLALASETCDLLICDDGLQDYRINPTLALCLIDPKRRFGNGHCLPAGPLREPMAFAHQRGRILIERGFDFDVKPNAWVSVKGMSDCLALSEGLIQLKTYTALHAVAGIGDPDQFFKTLEKLGLPVQTHVFPDHHRYSVGDFHFDKPGVGILMTEKDAVKCQDFAKNNFWFLQTETVISPKLIQILNVVNVRA